MHKELFYILHKRDKKTQRKSEEEMLQQNIWRTSPTNVHNFRAPLSSQVPLMSRIGWPEAPEEPTGCYRQSWWQCWEWSSISWSLGLSPDQAVPPSQSWINDIPQQNENTLQVVNNWCMTPQVRALLAFQLCSGDLVSRNALPDSCKGILHNSY